MTTAAIILPPTYAIAAALSKLSTDAQSREDYTSMRAYDNAAADLALGRMPLISDDSWLMPSSSRGGLVHRVRQLGGVWSCNCEHGLKRGGLCRHLALADAINQAWEDVGEADSEDHPALTRLHTALAATEAALYPQSRVVELDYSEIDQLF